MTDTKIVTCEYEPEHTHEYPKDWQFGGPKGKDPRTDPRWRGSTYIYLDKMLKPVHHTHVPICDDAAIDYFTAVAIWGLHPMWLQAKRTTGETEMILWEYDEETDMVTPVGSTS